MQQITLNIPTEKMPVFRQFLQVLETTSNNANATPVKYNRDLHTAAKFHPYYDWEFFMSELEYE